MLIPSTSIDFPQPSSDKIVPIYKKFNYTDKSVPVRSEINLMQPKLMCKEVLPTMYRLTKMVGNNQLVSN